MEPGYSVCNNLPPGYTQGFQPFLFNQPQHLRTQGSDFQNFFLIRRTGKKVVAQASFHIKGRQALTPLRAPFGSFMFSDDVSTKLLHDFIAHCEHALRKAGAKIIMIGEPPLFYRKSGEVIQTIFLNQGYKVSKAELSAGIVVDNVGFEKKIHAWEKRKLKQAKANGVHFSTLDLDEFGKVYQMILKCRQERGHSLSMTQEALAETVNAFKDDFYLFSAFAKKELVAASIAIRVSPGILYNFYSGHLKKYDAISPVVLLIGGMYRFCADHGIWLLDLGTSSLEGKLNFSLLDFKLRLGAQPSMKITFEKKLL